jgi:membrane associated rhomboid family serine protease
MQVHSYATSNWTRKVKISLWMASLMVFFFVFGSIFRSFQFAEFTSFTIVKAIYAGQVWRFFTAPFTHFSGAELFGSLLFIVFFVSFLEREVSRRIFVQILLASLILVYLTWILLGFTNLISGLVNFPLKSGAGLGVGVASGLYFLLGNRPVSIMLLDRPFLLKHVILVYAGIWLVLTLSDAGTLDYSGLYLTASLVPLVAIVPAWWITKKGGLWKPKQFVNPTKAKKKKFEAKIKPRIYLNQDDSEVDKILDKISAKGFQSLTEEERKVLNKASKNER